jgi:protein TonB
MFEDSTFESNGKIHTRSRRWALAALILNSTILALVVLLPLIYPQALQRAEISTILLAPQTPVQISEAPKAVTLKSKAPDSDYMQRQLQAPSTIPDKIKYVEKGERDSFPCPDCVVGSTDLPGANGTGIPVFFPHMPPHVVTPKTVRVSKMVFEGMIIQKTPPIYPALARQMRVQGTVELAAIISKTGTIESLRVVSGPPMLRQASLDAVKTWRYRPYMLNDEAVEVETSVNVVFKLDNQ